MKQTMKVVLVIWLVIGFYSSAFSQDKIGYKGLYLGMDRKVYEEFLLNEDNRPLHWQSREALLRECRRREESYKWKWEDKQRYSKKEDAEEYMKYLVRECFNTEVNIILGQYCDIGKIELAFDDKEKISKIQITPFREEGFREAVHEKWGKPDQTEEKVYQNAFGAKKYGWFDSWDKKTAGIILTKIVVNMSKDVLIYTLITKEQAEKDTQKKPKIGL